MPDTGYIFDIKKYSVNDGPGIRTTIFFKGCPLHCWWCHNPESQNMKPENVQSTTYSWSIYSQSCRAGIIGREVTSTEVMNEIIKDIPFYEESGGGVTFSGGEPLLQVNFLKKLLHLCKERGIHTAVDTSGFTPFSNFENIFDLTDIFLYDIKLFDEELHKMYTGVSNRVIINNLKKLTEKGDKVIVRLPVIPGINDYEDNISNIIELLKKINVKKIDLLPYHSSASLKYIKMNKENKLMNIKAASPESLKLLINRLSETGITVSVGG
jgi:pyruvate formate lyase activating enzyme